MIMILLYNQQVPFATNQFNRGPEDLFGMVDGELSREDVLRSQRGVSHGDVTGATMRTGYTGRSATVLRMDVTLHPLFTGHQQH